MYPYIIGFTQEFKKARQHRIKEKLSPTGAKKPSMANKK